MEAAKQARPTTADLTPRPPQPPNFHPAAEARGNSQLSSLLAEPEHTNFTLCTPIMLRTQRPVTGSVPKTKPSYDGRNVYFAPKTPLHIPGTNVLFRPPLIIYGSFYR